MLLANEHNPVFFLISISAPYGDYAWAGDLGDPSIPTYCGDSVLRIPPAGDGDDEALILEVSRRVAQILVDGDQYKGEERDAYIIDRLKEYEASMAGRSQ